MFVETWMASPVATVTATDSVAKAWELMGERKVRRLPVTNADGALVGIVTRSDLLSIFGISPDAEHGGGHWTTPVENVMTADPRTASPRDPLEVAARLMQDSKISGLPVVDASGKVVGMITESDIFRVLIKVLGAEKGARVVVRLAEGRSVLDEVAKAAHGLDVRSVVTYRESEGGPLHALIRVRGS